MKKLKRLYEFLSDDDMCLCPVCRADRLAFITDNGLKLNYRKLRVSDNKVNSIFDQMLFKYIECLDCHTRFWINWETKPISYLWVGGRKK